MKFPIKNRWTDETIFEAELDARYESEPRSVQLGAAVKLAVEARANLARANLANANLADANLANANLADANLANANLARANLANANLAHANLADAYLARANLADANLTDAKWRRGILLKRAPIQIYNLDDGWPVTILDEHMEIGCELHSFDEWAAFSDKEITAMDGKRALEFWRRWKPALMALCEARKESAEQQAAE